MRLGTRIFFCYLVIFMICFYYPINWILNSLETRYREGIEDLLVDQANILAAIVGREMEENRFDAENLHRAFNHAYARPLSAKIYTLVKTHVDVRVYITDLSGNVVFDSTHPENEGSDFSMWRDVHLTLQDKYGARTSRQYPGDSSSLAVLHVAAPILVRGRLTGALSVAKPTTNVDRFLKYAKPQILQVVALSAGVAIVLSFLVSLWLTRPIKRLTRYANDVRQGKRVPFPKLNRSEIGEMGHAFEKMQEALEGKKYVEQYVHTLTHEIKSPLSAIKGAAELLEEQMPPERRVRFLTNIRDESNRIQRIVDRMLELAALENQKTLQTRENVSFQALVNTVLESKQPMLSKKKLKVLVQVPGDVVIKGDSFLLHQAISNLMQNAIEFSSDSSQIELTAQVDRDHLKFMVDDHGPGIPDYAKDKVFDKFFSLQRPDSGKKSTGLGLNFVREVAILHNGTVTLENRPEKGVRATLTLPVE